MFSKNRTNLTQLGVERLKPKPAGEMIWDTVTPGFGIRVSPKGVKTFFCQYRFRQPDGTWKERQETIGRLNFMKVAEARDRARELKRKASEGIDPAAERQAAEAVEAAEQTAKQAERAAEEFTLGKLVDRYLTEWAAPNTKASSLAINTGLLNRWKAALGNRPAKDIQKADVRKFLADYLAGKGSGRVAGNNLLGALGHVYAWGKKHTDLVEHNPTLDVPKPQPKMVERNRVLNDQEVKALWSACDQVGWPGGPIFKLLLLTGQREAEVGGMRFSELDLGKCEWHLRWPPKTRQLVKVEPCP